MPSSVWDSVIPPSERAAANSSIMKKVVPPPAAGATALRPVIHHRPQIASAGPRAGAAGGAPEQQPENPSRSDRKGGVWSLGSPTTMTSAAAGGGGTTMVLLQSPSNSASRRPRHSEAVIPKPSRKQTALTPSSAKSLSRSSSEKSSSSSASMRRFSSGLDNDLHDSRLKHQQQQRVLNRATSTPSRPTSSPSQQGMDTQQQQHQQHQQQHQQQQQRKQEFLREMGLADDDGGPAAARPESSGASSSRQKARPEAVPPGGSRRPQSSARPRSASGSALARIEARVHHKGEDGGAVRYAPSSSGDSKAEKYRSPANLSSLPWRRDDAAEIKHQKKRNASTARTRAAPSPQPPQPQRPVNQAPADAWESRSPKGDHRRAAVARSPSRRAATSAASSIHRAAERVRTAAGGRSRQPSGSGPRAAAEIRSRSARGTSTRSKQPHAQAAPKGLGIGAAAKNKKKQQKKQQESFRALDGPISALVDKRTGHTTKLQAVHQMNGEFLMASAFTECEEMGKATAQESVLKSMLDMVGSGEPHAFMAMNALHFAAFTEEACSILVSLKAVEQLLGLLRAASSLEPELALSALSLLVTLVWSDPGCAHSSSPKAPITIACWFLGQEQTGARRLAHQLVQAHIKTAQGLRAACGSDKLMQRLEDHLQAETAADEKKVVRETIDYIKLTKKFTTAAT